MQNLSLEQLIYVFKIIAYFVGIIGVFIGAGSGILAYIYKSDRKQDRIEHTNLFKKTDDHGDRLSIAETELKSISKDSERIRDIENIAREYAIRFDNLKKYCDDNHKRGK